jgi:hypothetical protein
MRKAQAALEFLTTYGWAFIVILVMIGALAYFGVLNPSKVTPSRCIVEAGITCDDFIISNAAGVSMTLTNGKGEGMVITNVNLTSDTVSVTQSRCTVNAITVPAANTSVTESGKIAITCAAGAAGSIPLNGLQTSIGDKVKFNFEVTYKMAKGTYTQKFGGSIYGQVQS